MVPETGPTPTPGVDRIIHFTVRGHSFGYRRPSRADDAEVSRRLAVKLTLGMATAAEGRVASENLEIFDRDNLQWEARFEVGLVPRRSRTGESLALGEQAAAHWTDPIVVAGNPVGYAISFENVSGDEFREAVAALQAQLSPADPNLTAPATSTGSAADRTNV